MTRTLLLALVVLALGCDAQVCAGADCPAPRKYLTTCERRCGEGNVKTHTNGAWGVTCECFAPREASPYE